MHNGEKDNNKFKNKKQLELPENRTVWNYDQGVKEETFIQTGRRGRDKQPEPRGCTARWQLEDWVDKAGAGRLGGPTFVCR